MRTPACISIPHLALEHFGDGLVFETTWTDRRYEWRLIAPGDPSLREFHDAIADEIDETTGVEFIRIAGSPSVTDRSAGPSSPDLPPEQDAAIRTAVEAGYYETPERSRRMPSQSGLICRVRRFPTVFVVLRPNLRNPTLKTSLGLTTDSVCTNHTDKPVYPVS